MAGKSKRGNTTPKRRTWGTVIELPSGHQRASYTGPDHERHTAPHTFITKLDADAWLAGRHAEISAGTWTPTGAREPARAVTFGKYAAKWIDRKKSVLAFRTIDHYRQLLDTHILPTLKDVPVNLVTVADIARWYGSLDTGPTARARAYGLLHGIYADIVRESLAPVNPCQVHGGMKAKRSREPETLTILEIDALADAMPEELRAAVLIMGTCGLRVGECKALTRDKITPDASTIIVNRSMSYRSNTVNVKSTKSGDERTVTVPKYVRRAIVGHLEKYAAPGSKGIVFPGTLDGYFADWTLTKPFGKARKSIGRPGVTPHGLRHSAGTNSTRAGASIPEVMSRLGHSTPTMALRYQHVADGRAAELAERMSQQADKARRKAAKGKAKKSTM